MRARPEGLDDGELARALAEGWGLDAGVAEYAPVGAGSYHWVVGGREGARAFVTVDDLDRKPWLGTSREAALDGLRRAFDTALALRAAGLAFVVAPVPTSRGETVRRLGERHAVAVFPFLEGRTAGFGDYEEGEPAALASILAELHRATPAAGARARAVGLELPGRARLESGLREMGETWTGGPFSEPARRALAERAEEVAELLALADRLAARVESRGGGWVVTHGEPHAANVIRTGTGPVLVDWDTVALAPPERDLWMLAAGPADEPAAVYEAATGRRVDGEALDFFRLTWDLKDLAENLDVLRSPHRETEDTARAHAGLRSCVSIRHEWATLLDSVPDRGANSS